MTPTCTVVVPVYKEQPDPLEFFNMTVSASNLPDADVVILAPLSMETKNYFGIFDKTRVVKVPDAFFQNKKTYSQLCLTPEFYGIFIDRDYILILQPDAIVLKPELPYWVEKGYDYIGAPFGLQIDIYRPKFLEEMVPPFSELNKRLPLGAVGNGGFSLRHVKNCKRLIEEYANTAEQFIVNQVNEDMFFTIGGILSTYFKVPNEIVASTFSLELMALAYFDYTKTIPFGTHGWERFDTLFWKHVFQRRLRPEHWALAEPHWPQPMQAPAKPDAVS
jgi:hypothetical protein